MQQQDVLHAVIEFFILQAAELDEGRDVVPIFFIGFPVVFKDLMQLVRYLLGDVLGNLLDLSVVLQKASGNVQRHIRAVDDTFEQQQKFRDDLLDVIGNKDLVTVQLDLSRNHLQTVDLLWKIQDALEVKWVIDVQMNPEQRLIEVHEHLLVEGFVLLVGTLARGFQPQRLGVVDRQRFDSAHLIGAVLVLLHVAVLIVHRTLLVVRIQIDLIGHELAVFVQDFADAALLQKFLLALGDVHNDGGSVFGALAVLDFIAVLSGRGPVNRLCIRLEGKGLNLDGVGHHERRIEAQTEVTDDACRLAGILSVLLQKFLCTGESNLGDVAFYLILGHTDAVVRNNQLLFLAVDAHLHPRLVAVLLRRLSDAA